MARRNNAFEILRANDPVDKAMIGEADSPKARALLAEIVRKPRPRPHRPERSVRRRLAFAIAVALLAVVSVGATWLFVRDVSDPISVGCYQDTSLYSDVVAVASGGPLDVNLCQPVWEDGTLTNNDVAPAGQVPPLIGCITDSGNLAVFPSNDENLCQILGLADPNPESVPEGDTIRLLNADLVAHFSANDCQTIEDAETDVRQILDRYGLDRWRIDTSQGGSDRPCASFGLDTPNRTVYLTPIPRSS